MKTLYLLLFFFISLFASAQNDTDFIKRAIDYVNTEDFRLALKDTFKVELIKRAKSYVTKNNHKRKLLEDRDWDEISFLLNETSCFEPKQYYLKIDSLSVKNSLSDNSSRLVKMDTFTFHIKYFYSDAKKCSIRYKLTPTIIDNQTISLEYFNGPDVGIRFGTGYILHLKLNDDKSVRLISLDEIMCN